MNEQPETLPRIMIAAPVRNRAWVLPRYLRALEALDYPQDRLLFRWLVNDSTDGSRQILRYWIRDMQPCNAGVQTLDYGRTESEYEGTARMAGPRSRAYPILAALRNLIRTKALNSGVDYLFSVDTDVIVRPATLRRLLSHGKDVVAALVDNGHGAHNYMEQDPQTGTFFRGPHRVAGPDGLLQVDMTGACCLYSRRALEAGTWAAHMTGEDEGFARCMIAAGIDQWVDGGHQVEHVMEVPTPCPVC